MVMDIIRLYRDFNVNHRTGGHKHCRPGWVNVECPFCEGNPGYHLGWNINEEYYFCWRCGWHAPVKTIAELTGLKENEVTEILPQYGINRTILHQKIKTKREFEIPSGLSYLKTQQKKYLRERMFDPNLIEEKYQIRATSPTSKLGMYYYRFRIFIPYFWNGEMVSFDSRDVTGKQPNKYYACPDEYELMGRKQILYGIQENWNPEIGICVEGPTDVWRLGDMTFATSGIQYTHNQVKLMSSIFKRIAVVYDDEIQAQSQAKKLVAELRFRGVDAWNVSIKGDPGSLTDKQAKELITYIKNH